MKVNLFVAAFSPACSNNGLKFMAETQGEHISGVSFFIQNDFDEDDRLTSVETEAI